MAIESNRSVTIQFTDDITYTQVFPAAENVVSPGSIITYNLTTGFNLITVPPGGIIIPTGALIIPPEENEVSLTLKGISADTGIPLHLTDPCSLTLDPSVTTFGITAGGTVTGLKIIWS